MLECATDADIAEVRRRLDAFTAPSFDRRIVEKLIARLEAVGGETVSFANGPVMAQLTYGEFVSWIADRMVYVHGENQNYDYILRLREIAAWLTSARSALEAETGGGEAAYDPCGGCGNADPDNRCLGCLHPFVATTTDKRVVEATYPLAVIVAASRIKRIFDGGCDRGDRDDFELLERHGLMDRGICSDTFGQDTLEIGEAMWTFNAAGDALLAALAQGESR